MKFIIVADIHFGSPNNSGFSMQNKYTEQAPEILRALSRAAVEQGAEFIIHAGDMITEGTADEIRRAAALCGSLDVPFYHVLGNHDCIPEDFEALWLKLGACFFPEGTLETTLIRDGLRIDLLNNRWGGDSGRYTVGGPFCSRLEQKQFDRLRAGDQTLPRVIVFHSQIRPAYPRQTGLAGNIHAPTDGFDEVGTRIIAEFRPLLIAGGHNHLNVLEKIGPTYAMTVSSLTEAPFEYKLLEFKDGHLSMRTCSLRDRVPFPFRYDPARKFVQGEECDRAF